MSGVCGVCSERGAWCVRGAGCLRGHHYLVSLFVVIISRRFFSPFFLIIISHHHFFLFLGLQARIAGEARQGKVTNVQQNGITDIGQTLSMMIITTRFLSFSWFLLIFF